MPNLSLPIVQALSAGVALAGAKLYCYEPGTTTAKTVYTDSALTTAHQQPVVADSDGHFAPIYYSGNVKTVLQDSDGNTIWTVDPVNEHGSAYDIASFFAGVPNNSDVLNLFVAPRPIVLPVNLTNSQLYAVTAATAQTVIDIQVNEVSKGSITVAASGNSGTFTFASAVSLATGDRVKLVGPATADATLADISITLKGTLV